MSVTDGAQQKRKRWTGPITVTPSSAAVHDVIRRFAGDSREPVSGPNRRPLPYHGRVGVSRAFTDALEWARNPCKQLQYGVYACGGRFTVVVDLVDAEWTRCYPPFVFRTSRADTGPAEPAAADLRVRPMRPDPIYLGSANEPDAAGG
jgi:hypothetical protein